MRDGFRMILDTQEDIEVVREAADGLEAVAKACELGGVAFWRNCDTLPLSGETLLNPFG